MPTWWSTPLNGLVSRNANTARPTATTVAISSNFKVMSNGTITGTLRTASLVLIPSLAAWLLPTSGDPATTIAVEAQGLPDAEMMSLSINRANGKLTGPVDQTAAPAGSAPRPGRRRPRRNPYVGPGRRAATPWPGHRQPTFRMEPPSGTTTAKPQGTSYGGAMVGTLGAVTLACKMADGSSFTQTAAIGHAGPPWRWRAMLYNGKGLCRRLAADHGSSAARLQTQGCGALQWNKTGPVSLTDRTFAGGFDFGVLNASLLAVRGSELGASPAPTPPLRHSAAWPMLPLQVKSTPRSPSQTVVSKVPPALTRMRTNKCVS